MEYRYILDGIVVVILILSLLRGHRKGLIRSFAGVASLLLGLWGASYLAERLKEPVAGWFMPLVSRQIQSAGVPLDLPVDGLLEGAENALASLSGALNQLAAATHLPFLSQPGFVDQVTGAIHSAGVDIAEAVSRAAATQIAFLLLFLIFFLVISIGVRLLFSFADLVSRLPVLNLLNRLGGAFLGLVFGALVVVLLIAGCRFFAPKDSFPALLTDPATVNQSLVARYFVLSTFDPTA